MTYFALIDIQKTHVVLFTSQKWVHQEI
jgi:hypothetical protein